MPVKSESRLVQIRAAQHPLLREFRQVLRGERKPGAQCPERILLEGPRLITEALRDGLQLEAVLFTPAGLAQQGAGLLPQLSKHVAVAQAPDNLFALASDTETPAGVMALARPPETSVEKFWAPEEGFYLAAAGLQDPGNLGTLARAAEAFGAAGLARIGPGVGLWHPKTLRASAGSLLRLPARDYPAPEAWIEDAQARGLRLVAAVPRTGRPPEAINWHGRVALLIGSETHGLPRPLLRAAAEQVVIPMQPAVESLNAGVAGAILLYAAARARAGQL